MATFSAWSCFLLDLSHSLGSIHSLGWWLAGGWKTKFLAYPKSASCEVKPMEEVFEYPDPGQCAELGFPPRSPGSWSGTSHPWRWMSRTWLPRWPSSSAGSPVNQWPPGLLGRNVLTDAQEIPWQTRIQNARRKIIQIIPWGWALWALAPTRMSNGSSLPLRRFCERCVSITWCCTVNFIFPIF